MKFCDAARGDGTRCESPVRGSQVCRVCWLTSMSTRDVLLLDAPVNFRRSSERARSEWRGREDEANACGGPAPPCQYLGGTNAALADVGAHLCGCGYTSTDVPAFNERRERNANVKGVWLRGFTITWKTDPELAAKFAAVPERPDIGVDANGRVIADTSGFIDGMAVDVET